MKVVCEFSGGADSILATIKAIEKYGKDIHAVFVNYGQVCINQEWNVAVRASQRLNIPLHYIKLQDIWTDGGMISGESSNIGKDMYTPLRNVALLGAVMAYADSIKAQVIVCGSKGLSKDEKDSYSYYDSTLPFYKLMECVWNYTTEDKSTRKIIDPILAEGRNIKLSKKEVYIELLANGFDYNDTWSCFNGGAIECGECHNCLIKKEIFKSL